MASDGCVSSGLIFPFSIVLGVLIRHVLKELWDKRNGD